MGQVWLQVTIHASCKRTNHQPAAHLSAAGLCPAPIPAQEVLVLPFPNAPKRLRERRGVRNDIATELCPLPGRRRAADEQVSLTREDGELLKQCRKKWKR